jgi:hypothetical protein
MAISDRYLKLSCRAATFHATELFVDFCPAELPKFQYLVADQIIPTSVCFAN